MIDTDKLEQYIHTTFSGITDDRGTPLDVTPALPLIKQVLTGYTQEIIDKKFDFIGESAVQFAINLILAQHYPRYEKDVLSALARKFRVPLQLYKLVGKQIALKEYVMSIYLKEKMDMIIGILYNFYGIVAIQKFIEKAFILLVEKELNNATSSKKSLILANTQENPAQTLHTLIQSDNGTLLIDTSELPDKKWQVKLTAKLNQNSLSFSHSRTSSSKQKAKAEASRDILTFFGNNAEVYQQLQLPGGGNAEVHVLPISEDDYCHLFTENTSSPNTRKDSPKTTDWSENFNYVQLSQANHEEATLLLEKLLLDNSMDVDSDPRQVKRQRSSIYPNNDETNVSVLVKQEPADTTLLETQDSSEEPACGSNSNLDATNMAYIKDEETFQPFNQVVALPVDEAIALRNEKKVKYFRKLFAPHRHVLLQCRTMPGQSKSVFLSFVVQRQDEMFVDISVQQGGDSHTPIFHADVVLRSKTKNNVFIKTEGAGRRKKDAEQQAFSKMIEIVAN